MACRRWLPNNFLTALIFFVCAYSFFSYGMNGIRNGMATSLALVGLTYFCKDTKNLCIGLFFIVLGMLTHKTILLILICALIANKWPNFKGVVALWIACAVISFILPSTVKDFIVNLSGDEKMARYLVNDKDAMLMYAGAGYRWDFMLFSLPPIILGWWLIVKRGMYNRTYVFLACVYTLANSFWLLVNSAEFSNRFAYLSWFMMPIVLAYPLLKFRISPHQGALAALFLSFYCTIALYF